MPLKVRTGGGSSRRAGITYTFARLLSFPVLRFGDLPQVFGQSLLLVSGQVEAAYVKGFDRLPTDY
jgi:hypothetical protein